MREVIVTVIEVEEEIEVVDLIDPLTIVENEVVTVVRQVEEDIEIEIDIEEVDLEIMIIRGKKLKKIDLEILFIYFSIIFL